MLLKASGEKIESKTKLHKELYFISLLLNKDFGFKAHYYGPYSQEVEQGLDELIGAGFVDVKCDSYGINQKKGFEAKKYEFYLSNVGRKLLDRLIEEYPKENKTIKEFVDNLKDIGDLNYISLSLAAKAYYIIDKEGKSMTYEQIIEKAKAFGWDVDVSNIDEAAKILLKLGFIQGK